MLDVFSKYAWVKLLMNKKVKTAFNGLLREEIYLNINQNEIWADQEKKFYNNLMLKWLDDNMVMIRL